MIHIKTHNYNTKSEAKTKRQQKWSQQMAACLTKESAYKSAWIKQRNPVT